jgi:hypothetical protein
MSFSRRASSANLVTGLVACWLIAMAAELPGQTGQVDRAQLTRDQTITAPSGVTTSTGEQAVISSPNDPDLGEQQILRRNENYQPFVASVSVPIYWTSNVALTNSGEQDDLIISPVAAVAYQPRIAKDITAYISVRDQQFYYDRLTDFDFGSFDAEVGLTYTVPQFYNLILHAGYDYNRLTKKNSFESFYSNHIFVISAELPFRISRSQQLSIGIDSNISMGATPDGPRRHDFDGYIGYSVALTRALVVAASGRVTVHDYVQGDRLDVTEMVALNATYAITKLISANALFSFAANQSNHSVFDYQVTDAGGTLSFAIRF